MTDNKGDWNIRHTTYVCITIRYRFVLSTGKHEKVESVHSFKKNDITECYERKYLNSLIKVIPVVFLIDTYVLYHYYYYSGENKWINHKVLFQVIYTYLWNIKDLLFPVIYKKKKLVGFNVT